MWFHRATSTGQQDLTMGVSIPNTSSSSYWSQLLAPKSSTAQILRGSHVTTTPVAPRWPTLGSWATPFALLVLALRARVLTPAFGVPLIAS